MRVQSAVKNFWTIGLLIAFVASAIPTVTAQGTECSPGICRIDEPDISTMDLRICTSGALLVVHSGGGGQDHLDGGPLNLGGEGYCCIVEFMKINSGNQPVYTQAEMDQIMTIWQVSETELKASFHLTKYGEDVYLNETFTLVKNGILVQYDVFNAGATPWDVGWKYAWDLHLGPYFSAGVMAPYLKVDGRPGDGKGTNGNDGVYQGQDYDFGAPTTRDVKFVKQWKTRLGPDTADHLKSEFWWDESMGANPADLIQYTDNANSWDQINQWPYELRDGTTTDAMLQYYYGKPKLINVKPGEHEERIMWFATERPDPLLSYDMEADFEHARENQVTQVQFIDAGQTASYPILLKSTTGVDGNTEVAQGVEQVIYVNPEELETPQGGGWTYNLVNADTGQDVTQLRMQPGEVKKLILKVTAPDDAFGEDSARVNFRAILQGPAEGVIYNKKMSFFDEALYTTTIIRPNYGISLEGPSEVPVVFPGESIVFGELGLPPLLVRNTGNLREPLTVSMDAPSGAGNWGKDFTPDRFQIKRGETKEVKVRLDIPEDEFGGERTVVTRATIEDRNQWNTTQLKLRVISNAEVEILVPEQPGVQITEDDSPQIILAPGKTLRFDAIISNVGFDPVDLELTAMPDTTVGVGGENTKPSDWVVEKSDENLKGTLLQGQAVKATITITAPTGVKAGDQQNVLLFVTKKGETGKLDDELVRAVVARQSSFDIEGLTTSAAGDPGRKLDYVLQVANVGNAVENATVEMGKLPPGWTADIVPKQFSLNPPKPGEKVGELRQVLVTLTSPPNQYYGLYEPEVVVRNSDLIKEEPQPLKARINQIFNVETSTETPTVRMLPEDAAKLDFEIVNRGNGPDQFMLDGFDPAWIIVADHDYEGLADEVAQKTTKILQPGETALVRVTGSVRGALGTYEMPIRAVSVTLGQVPSAAEALPLTLIVSRPDLYIATVGLGSPARFVGDVETIVAEVENLGGIEAKNIRVELYANGQPTGTFVTFDRLAPERTLIASLPWTKTGEGLTYRVVVDPDQEVDEGDKEDNNEAVYKSAGLPGARKVGVLGADGKAAQVLPGPPLEVLMVALLGVYLVVRRIRKD